MILRLTHHVNLKVTSVGRGHRWAGVHLGNGDTPGLEVTDELLGLREAVTRVDRAVDGLHLEGLEGREGEDVVEARLGEDDRVVRVGPPQLEEVDHVAEAETRMTAEHNAGLQKGEDRGGLAGCVAAAEEIGSLARSKCTCEL